jgi:tRNA-(ms[2]io[6]A)-hydroxylase
MNTESQMITDLLSPVHNFLHCETPDSWIALAKQPENLTTLLVDHCNCELKASQTAMWLIRKYAVDKESGLTLLEWSKPYEDYVYRKQFDTVFPEKKRMQSAALTVKEEVNYGQDLIEKMVRLIKEEFHHFEQVLDIMKDRNIDYYSLSAGTYAKGLMKQVRTYEPATLIDKLIIGALIEARSCERFAKLAPHLDDELKQFYISLLRSEARHYQDYLQLAQDVAGESDITERVEALASAEAELVNRPDSEFRFHSGLPL